LCWFEVDFSDAACEGVVEWAVSVWVGVHFDCDFVFNDFVKYSFAKLLEIERRSCALQDFNAVPQKKAYSIKIYELEEICKLEEMTAYL